MRQYGRSPRGWRCQAPVSRSWVPRISAIIAESTNGVQLCRATKSTINGPKFVAFVRNHLVPILNPYNGYNRYSIHVVVMGKLLEFNYSLWQH